MLSPHKVVAFILTADAARARQFYAETLGLKFVSRDDYAQVFDASGVTLRITPLPGHTPSEHPVLGWIVPDIYATATALAKAGIQFEKYTFLEQDDLGIWTAPDGSAKVAFFKDPDGNILSITQS